MANLVARLNRNPIFKFLASLKLAVPLLLAMALTVSVGTILESRYNTEYAKIVIYEASWFYGLLALLWINIFSATISRIPFRKHHTGFVITHIGLLTLLIGSFITAYWGVDGQLKVEEGGRSGRVVLSDQVLEVIQAEAETSRTISIPRSTRALPRESLGRIQSQLPDQIQILQHLPFVSGTQGFVESSFGTGAAVQFRIKNSFFDVSHWLHAEELPGIVQGPATFKIERKSSPDQGHEIPSLVIQDLETGEEISRMPLSSNQRKHWKVRDVQIELKQVFEEAIVGGSGIREGGTPGRNPALLLGLSKAGVAKREAVFANFLDFSLHESGGVFGLKFSYQGAGRTQSSEGPTITFANLKENSLQLTLAKSGKVLSKKIVRVGEEVATPWMGMTIMIQKILPSAAPSTEVSSVAPVPGADLPPAAIQVQPEGGEPRWILEEIPERIQAGRDLYDLRLGRRRLQLPFEVELLKFSKVDYPGTATPVSFESEVRIPGESEPIRISMNEPYTRNGFTLYQSSYIMEPGQPVSSVFSVNRDPGRITKYFGSLILCAGIITYTLMKSRIYRQRRSQDASV